MCGRVTRCLISNFVTAGLWPRSGYRGGCVSSGVASPKVLGAKMFEFRRITLFCLEKCLSKHKTTTCSRNFVGAMAPVALLWLRLCALVKQ